MALPYRWRSRERVGRTVSCDPRDAYATRDALAYDRRRHGKAWEIDLDALDPWWLEELDSNDARRLIALGAQARRVLGIHPLEDLPKEVGDDRFDTSAFERQAQARRARVRSAA